VTFFDFGFIGSDDFDEYLTDSLLVSILFASACLGAGCFGGVYQQIAKIHKNSFLSQFISRRQYSDFHPLSIPSR
jgi:hypothetical protein